MSWPASLADKNGRVWWN